MPNIKSAKKRKRADVTKKANNETYSSKIVKEMKAIAKEGAKKKKETVKKIQSLIAKAAKKNVIHKNKAARLQSRLMS